MLTKKGIETALRLNPDLGYLTVRKVCFVVGTDMNGDNEINIFLAKGDSCSIEAVIEEDDDEYDEIYSLHLVIDTFKGTMFKMKDSMAKIYFQEVYDGSWEDAVVEAYKQYNLSQAQLKKELEEISYDNDIKVGGDFS